MTHVGMFEEARQTATIKKLKKRIVELMAINREHQTLNGGLRSEISALKQQLHTDREKHEKELALVREDNQLLSIENGRMMKKLQKKDS